MATHDDVRRIAASLPGTIESTDPFSLAVTVKGKPKGFVWTWNERIHPKKPKVPNEGVLAIVVPSLHAKEILMGSSTEKFVTDPHYNGYPAVLVRLAAIERDELEDLVVEAWRSKAPKELLREFDAAQS